jgi:hypothetical protein
MDSSFVSEFKHIIKNYGNYTNVSVSTGEGKPSVFFVPSVVFDCVQSTLVASILITEKC